MSFLWPRSVRRKFRTHSTTIFCHYKFLLVIKRYEREWFVLQSEIGTHAVFMRLKMSRKLTLSRTRCGSFSLGNLISKPIFSSIALTSKKLINELEITALVRLNDFFYRYLFASIWPFHHLALIISATLILFVVISEWKVTCWLSNSLNLNILSAQHAFRYRSCRCEHFDRKWNEVGTQTVGNKAAPNVCYMRTSILK